MVLLLVYKAIIDEKHRRRERERETLDDGIIRRKASTPICNGLFMLKVCLKNKKK